MNEYHSSAEWKYIPRWLAPILTQAITTHPVVVITGVRQVGKSTLLQFTDPTKDWSIFSMDNLDLLAQARQNPSSLLAGKSEIVLDEVQKAPQILSEVKRYVDQSQRRVRIVLTGSANLLLMEQVSETLAGRAVFFILEPMTHRESHSYSSTNVIDNLFNAHYPDEGRIEPELISLPDLILKGFLPPVLYLKVHNAIVQWWEGYVATFLERDLRVLSRIESLPDFRRLMSALALRSGQILNQTEVARDINIPQPTVHRYLNMLETMCLLYRLPAYAVNRTKRLIKAPKVYWFDCGLGCFLSGFYDTQTLSSSREWGALFETLIFQHLRVWCSLQIPRARIYFWRTTTNREIDFVIERGKKLIAVEVKAASEIRYRDLENMRIFSQEYPDLFAAGILVYTGDEIKRMDEKIIAIPWQMLV